MIISKTPFRISFVGGGSDLQEYYKEEPGAVLSTSIDKYIYLSIHNYFYEGKQLLKYSKTEEIDNINNIKHDIIREVFRYFGTENADFNSTADIPSGTGMGSSSAFTCGLINICSRAKGIKLSKSEIAKIACHIEINILQEPIGKQDQYACAVGGLNLIKFNPDENVEILQLTLDSGIINKLENNLFLFNTNKTRKASSVLSVQKENTRLNQSTKNNLRSMVNMANSLYKDLQNNQIDLMGEYLNEAWLLKKELSKNISNGSIDELYNLGINGGATGGKLLGAGGGGFILFYVPLENQVEFLNTMNGVNQLYFKFENDGTTVVYKD